MSGCRENGSGDPQGHTIGPEGNGDRRSAAGNLLLPRDRRGSRTPPRQRVRSSASPSASSPATRLRPGGGFGLERLAIDQEHAVANLHRLPRQPDDSLDVVLAAVLGIAEHDDVAPPEGTVGDTELGDENPVAGDERGGHRSGRDPEGLDDVGPQEESEPQGIGSPVIAIRT